MTLFMILARSCDKLKPLYLHYKVIQCPDHMVLQSHVTNGYHYTSTTRVPMAAKLGRMVTYFERLLTIKYFYALITWSCKVMWQKSLYIHNQSPYVYKTGRMITYLDEFLPIKLHHSFITWSCEVMWQTKTIISPLPQSLWPPKVGDIVWQAPSHKVIQSLDHVVL